RPRASCSPSARTTPAICVSGISSTSPSVFAMWETVSSVAMIGLARLTPRPGSETLPRGAAACNPRAHVRRSLGILEGFSGGLSASRPAPTMPPCTSGEELYRSGAHRDDRAVGDPNAQAAFLVDARRGSRHRFDTHAA